MFNYIAPLNRTGYGIAALGYAKGLRASECKDFNYVVIGNLDIDNPEFKDQETLAILDENVSKRGKYDPSLKSFAFWHFNDILRYCPNPEKTLAFSTFEIDTLKKEEIENLKKFNKIATASSHHTTIIQKCMISSGISPSHVQYGPIPHAFRVRNNDVVPDIKKEDPLPIWSEITGINFNPKTLVLSSAGKYERRKGFPQLLNVINNFDIPTLLITFWNNPFTQEGYPYFDILRLNMEPVKNTKNLKIFRSNNTHVILMPPAGTRAELHGALSRANFFIAPSAAEGWNLPLFEMMSYGMPCINTLNTAHSDYVSHYSCVAIEDDGLESAVDYPFFDGSGKWSKITESNIRSSIYKASNLTQTQRLELGQNAKVLTNRFSWQSSSSQILELMKQ